MHETPAVKQVTLALRILLLGGFAVAVGGISIPEAQWKSRRARSLVKLLALAHDHRLHRDQVIEALWPDSDFSAAANNFHQTLFSARKILHTAGSACLILKDGLLSLGDGLSVDVEQFETAAARAKDSQDPAEYEAALGFYQGDLLPEDLYAEWTIQRREALRQIYMNLLLDLARLQEARQEYPAAIDTLLRLLASDRSREEAHAQLMGLYALSGQRQQALRQYQALREVLQAELGAEPGPATKDLYQAIQSGRFISTRSPVFMPEKNTPHHNLPAQMSSFIGRENEIDEISQLLVNHRLVTLNGSGGTGKTRLANQVAIQTIEQYRDGAWFVDLAPLTHPETIPQTIAAVFDLQESHDRELHTLLKNYLHEKQLILVLDNCEHLLEACARLVDELLKACPKLTILVTSREGLNIAGETSYRVPSLSAPDSTDIPPMDEVDRFDALLLFSERASAVNPAFNLSPDNLTGVVRICHRLGGIALAIELAAARMGVLSVEEIANRLDDRFRLLTGGNRTALPRQRTLRASMDWSYDLLSAAERALLTRLSVFYGGCTMESTEAVCGFGDLEKEEVLNTLSSLVNKSLVVADHQPRTVTRYRMLETIRQYAQEKLADLDDPARMHDRHLDHYLGWIEEIEPQLKTAQAPVLLKQLDAELENLHAALGWALSKNNQEGYRQELRLFCGLWQYWTSRGLNNEGITWGRSGLEHMIAEDEQSIEIRARACFFTGGLLYHFSFNRLDWKIYLEESVALFRKISNRNRLALALAFLWQALTFCRKSLPTSHLFEDKDAQKMRDESLAIVNTGDGSCTPDDLWTRARVFLWIGELADDGEGLPETQSEMIKEAYRLFQKLGDPNGEIWGAFALGTIAMDQRDIPLARSYFLQALELARMLKSKDELEAVMGGLGMAAFWMHDFVGMETWFQQVQNLTDNATGEFHNLWPRRMQAIAALHQGDFPRAAAIFRENLLLGQKHGDSYGVLSNLLGLAGAAAQTGDYEHSLKLLAFFGKQMGTFFKPADQIDQYELERHLSAVREKLDPSAFSALWEQGQALTLEQAVADGLASEIQRSGLTLGAK